VSTNVWIGDALIFLGGLLLGMFVGLRLARRRGYERD
jgi:hypothetical protein